MRVLMFGVLLVGLISCTPVPPKPLPTTLTPATPMTIPVDGIARIIIGGDSRDDTSHVVPWAFAEAKARGASAFIFLGDMAVTPSADGHFERELPLLDPIPFYPALGNHEVKLFGGIGIGHDHAEKKFRERFLGTARTPVVTSIANHVVYSVNLAGGVHFIALDNVSQKGFGAAQLAWLAKDLDAASADPVVHYIIVGMHKPLAGNGVARHGMDKDGAQAAADSEAALAMFVAHHVTMIFASHVHEYASFTQAGIPSYITGGMGAPLVSSSGPEHAFHHFLQLDVRADGLHVSVVKFNGTASVGDDDMTD